MPRTRTIRASRRPPAAAWKRACALLVACAPAACGNLTAGGLDGEAVVAVSGEADAPEGGAPPTGRAERAFSVVAEDRPEGEVEVEFRVLLVTESGTPVELSDDDVRVRIDVRGRQEAEVARREVPAVRYSVLRLVFTDIDVEIESGLIIDGLPVVGDLRVELEDGTVTVERPVDVTVPEGGRVELLVDLNADTWLRAADPVLRVVAEQVFATAVDVVVR